MKKTQKVNGKEFDPEFTPDLTPKEMLHLGVFGGSYFEADKKEFPADWFKGAKLSVDGTYHKELNFFGVKASQSLAEWQRKGWIHPADPRGWFQWYCRYYMGRRMEDDARQITRWRNMTRHVSQLRNSCMPGDLTCQPVRRQALLHWAYDSRKL
jgi:hypothetical protein